MEVSSESKMMPIFRTLSTGVGVGPKDWGQAESSIDAEDPPIRSTSIFDSFIPSLCIKPSWYISKDLCVVSIDLTLQAMLGDNIS